MQVKLLFAIAPLDSLPCSGVVWSWLAYRHEVLYLLHFPIKVLCFLNFIIALIIITIIYTIIAGIIIIILDYLLCFFHNLYFRLGCI